MKRFILLLLLGSTPWISRAQATTSPPPIPTAILDSLATSSVTRMQTDLESGRHLADSLLVAARIAHDSAGVLTSQYLLARYYRFKGTFDTAQQQIQSTIAQLEPQIQGLRPDVRPILFRFLGIMWYELSVVAGLKGDYQTAIAYTLRADSIYHLHQQRYGTDDDKVRNSVAVSTQWRAAQYANLGQLEEAIRVSKEVLLIFEEIGHPFNQTNTYINLGIYYRDLGQSKPSLDALQEGLRLARKHDFPGLEARALVALSELYGFLADDTSALRYAQEAYAISRRFDAKPDMASHCSAIGQSFMTLGQLDSAQYYAELSLRLEEELGNPIEQAYQHERLAQLALRQARWAQARQHLDQGLALCTQGDFPLQERLLLITYVNYHRLREEWPQAMAMTRRLLDLGPEPNNLRLMQDLERAVYPVLYANGQVKAAYQHLERLMMFNDSIFEEEKSLQLARQEYAYQLTAEKANMETQAAQQAALFEKEREKDRLTLRALLVGGLLVLIILGVVVWSYRQKRRAHRILQQKNQELTERNVEISQLREHEQALAEEAIASKERELTTITMLSHEKNTLLKKLGEQIEMLDQKVDDSLIPELREIRRTIKSNLNDESWPAFMAQFERVHPKFFNLLKDRFPDLTPHDLRLCTYIKVGMDNKEIASITNVTTGGVKKAVNRMKKRMGLEVEEDLRTLIMMI